jgi:hypothetical protein
MAIPPRSGESILAFLTQPLQSKGNSMENQLPAAGDELFIPEAVIPEVVKPKVVVAAQEHVQQQVQQQSVSSGIVPAEPIARVDRVDPVEKFIVGVGDAVAAVISFLWTFH